MPSKLKEQPVDSPLRAAGRLERDEHDRTPLHPPGGRALSVSTAPFLLSPAANWHFFSFSPGIAHPAARVTRRGARGCFQGRPTPLLPRIGPPAGPGWGAGRLTDCCQEAVPSGCVPSETGLPSARGLPDARGNSEPWPGLCQPHTHGGSFSRDRPSVRPLSAHTSSSPRLSTHFLPFSPRSPTPLPSPSFRKGTGCPFSPRRAPVTGISECLLTAVLGRICLWVTMVSPSVSIF